MVRMVAPDSKADAHGLRDNRPIPTMTADKLDMYGGARTVERLLPAGAQRLRMNERQSADMINLWLRRHQWHYSAKNVDRARIESLKESAARKEARAARDARASARESSLSAPPAAERRRTQAREEKQEELETESNIGTAIEELREKQQEAAQAAASAAQTSRDVTQAAIDAVISEKERLQEEGASPKEVKEAVAELKEIARDAARTSQALDALASVHEAAAGDAADESSAGEDSDDDVPITEFLRREQGEEKKHTPKKKPASKKKAKSSAKKTPAARGRKAPQVTDAKAASMKLLGDKSLRRLAELAMNRESPKMTKEFIAQFNVRLHEWLVAGLHNTSFSIHNCKGKTVTLDAIETGFDVLGFDDSTDDNVPVPEDRVEELIGDSKGFLPVGKAVRDALLYYGGTRFTRAEPAAVKYVQNLMLLHAHHMLVEMDKILTREALKKGGKGGAVLRVCPSFVTMKAQTRTMAGDEDEEYDWEAETPDSDAVVIVVERDDEGDEDEDVFEEDSESSCDEDVFSSGDEE